MRKCIRGSLIWKLRGEKIMREKNWEGTKKSWRKMIIFFLFELKTFPHIFSDENFIT